MTRWARIFAPTGRGTAAMTKALHAVVDSPEGDVSACGDPERGRESLLDDDGRCAACVAIVEERENG